MRGGLRDRFMQHRDLILLVLLVFLIVTYPVLDHRNGSRIANDGLMLVTLIVATVTVSQNEGWYRLPVALLGAAVLSGAAAFVTSRRMFSIAQWAFLTAFFGVVSSGLFAYLQNARTITRAHLYAGGSTYLLLAMLWFAIYNLIETARPGSFVRGASGLTDQRSDLLYFSLMTLTTVGYGDIVPVDGLTRMVAALEAVAGVLYIAITVAAIVAGHKRYNA